MTNERRENKRNIESWRKDKKGNEDKDDRRRGEIMRKIRRR